MTQRKVRILMVRFGEGYESATMKLASTFRDSGFEVIYTELQDPQAIVASAIQESVDHIGVTTLPGARIESFQELIALLAKQDSSHIQITGGGFLEEKDITKLKEIGIAEFFPQGTTYEQLILWARENIKPTE